MYVSACMSYYQFIGFLYSKRIKRMYVLCSLTSVLIVRHLTVIVRFMHLTAYYLYLVMITPIKAYHATY